MTSMRGTTEPKSDQLNFDDFAGGMSKTITITKVVETSDKQQPRAICYEGDNGKPWKPCKGMRRVLRNCWGDNENNEYIGRQIVLYGDPKIKFGEIEQGGIRISHLSHIDKPMTMPLTERRGSRKQFTVQPLVVEAGTPLPTLADMIHDIEKAVDADGLKFKYSAALRSFTDDDSRKKIVAAKEMRKKELTTNPEMTNANTQ